VTPDYPNISPALWVAQSKVYATNSAIWISDGRACLVDPGVCPEEIGGIAGFLEAQSALSSVVVLTHAHWDHLLGAARFPKARVLANTSYRRVIQHHGPDLLRQVAQFGKLCGTDPCLPFQVPQPLLWSNSPEHLCIGRLELDLYHAPGHTEDQCVVYEPRYGVLWAADMLSNQELPSISYRLDAYEQTLELLAGMPVRVLVPGHGAVASDPVEIHHRFAQDQAYLRALRVCIQSALDQGLGIGETVAACGTVGLPRGDGDTVTAAWNVETVYAELGGSVEPPVGWEKEWV